MFDSIPDRFMITLQYFIKTGRVPNLNNPQRYTEKLQWYKLNYRNPLLKQCVNKYNVRSYVSDLGFEELLNDLYGVYDTIDEVDFDNLPNSFVIKDTLGEGSNEIIVVKDKANCNLERIKEQSSVWLSRNPTRKHTGREWPYENQKHRIIIEKLLEESNGDLVDYKFFCFNGRVEYFYFRSGYSRNHDDGTMSFFDRNLQYLRGVGMDYCKISDKKPVLPCNINDMIEIADKLSSGFPHVRIDLYNVDGAIILGEFTFYNASGYMKFSPDSFDKEMGDKFVL